MWGGRGWGRELGGWLQVQQQRPIHPSRRSCCCAKGGHGIVRRGPNPAPAAALAPACSRRASCCRLLHCVHPLACPPPPNSPSPSSGHLLLFTSYCWTSSLTSPMFGTRTWYGSCAFSRSYSWRTGAVRRGGGSGRRRGGRRGESVCEEREVRAGGGEEGWSSKHL